MSEIGQNHLDVYQSYFEEEYLQEYLKHVTDTLKISSSKYCIKLGSKKGDNFIGIIYRVLIEGERNEGPVRISIIFKVPPKDESSRRIFHISYFFPREHLFYLKIVPVFKEFLEAKSVSLDNIAECYFSSIVDQKEAICLEDLQLKGFVMCGSPRQMDFAHTALAFRALGRFHALSFALRDQRSEVFASEITTLEEPLFRPDVLLDPVFMDFLEKLGKVIETALFEVDPKYTERFSNYMADAFSHMKRSCDGRSAEPYAVLCHGDFWSNNMLFMYEENSTVPQDICFLDFQVMRYASPALDICYTLYYSCNQEVRDEHFEELLQIYHESLSAHLLELGSDPKKLFPYETLLNQLQEFGINIAGLMMLLLYYFVSQGENLEDFTKGNDLDVPELEKIIFRNHFWRNNLKFIFKDLIDRNYM